MLRLVSWMLFNAFFFPIVSSQLDSAERRLYRDSFKNYSTLARPRLNASESVDIPVSFILKRINEVNELQKTIAAMYYFELTWKDDFVRWNPAQYDGILNIIAPSTLVWIPYISVWQSVNNFFFESNRFTVVIYSDGTIRFEPGGSLSTWCIFNLKKYPFDEHQCTISPITHISPQIKVNLTNGGESHDLEEHHGEWNIIGILLDTASASQSNSTTWVDFIIVINRKPLYQAINLVLPVSLLTALDLFVFVMPAGSGDSVIFSVNILVALSVWQLLLVQSLPRSSDSLPLVDMFLTASMVVATTSSMLAVLFARLKDKSNEEKPPPWLLFLLKCFLAKKTQSPRKDIVSAA